MLEALQVNFPSADLEVKTVLPIPFRGSELNASFHRICILLCESLNRLSVHPCVCRDPVYFPSLASIV